MVPLVLGLALSLSDNSVQNVRNIIPKGLASILSLFDWLHGSGPNQCALTNKNNFHNFGPF